MKVSMFVLFPEGAEWRFIQPAVVYYLLFTFFPGSHTGELIGSHLGIGNELVLPDGSKLRFLVL